MAGLKVIAALVAFFATAYAGVVIDATSDQHNITQCDPTKATVRLYQANIYEPAGLFFPVIRTFTYPETGLNTKLITCLMVINTDTSNHGGYPQILSGGVGSYDVQIRFKSQWGQPLNFTVEIWADEADDDDGGDDDEK